MLSGTLILVTDEGEEPRHAGDFAAFPANVAIGHHLINRGNEEALYLEIGARRQNDVCHYPDIDLRAQGEGYTHRDGTPYAR